MKTSARAILVICLLSGISWSLDHRHRHPKYRYHKKPTQEQIDAVNAKMAEIEATMQKDLSPRKKKLLRESYAKLENHKKTLLQAGANYEKEVSNRFSNFLDEQKLTKKQNDKIKEAYSKMRVRRASRIARHKARVRETREKLGK